MQALTDSPQKMKRVGSLVVGITLVAAVLTYLALQVWVAVRYTETSANVLKELRESKNPEGEKARQEAIGLRIENERRTLFWAALSANVTATVGVVLAVIAAWISFRQFLQTRDRERLDRAASELNAVWKGLTSRKPEERAASVAALQQFLSHDREEYHARVVSALALTARTENLLVQRTATKVVEFAFRNVDLETLRSASWRGIRLSEANLDSVMLSGLDLREAVLDDASLVRANLKGCRLDGISLARANLAASDLSDARLPRANLAHANLTGAKLQHANLTGANLLGCRLGGADLSGVTLRSDDDFALARQWRDATLSDELRNRLLARFGPAPGHQRVLMLMWEFPPFVTGGAWTAAYHLVSELRRLGHDITVMVPWPQSVIDESVFGGEVEVIGVGEERADAIREYYYSGYSAYGQSEARRIRVTRELEDFGGYAYVTPGHSFSRLVNDFRTNVVEYLRAHDDTFDVIHAHDWTALEAALPIVGGRPLIAHIHSTERDRQKKPAHRVIAIEKAAVAAAAAIVTPSGRLADTIRREYGPSDRIQVIGNSAGQSPFVNRGQFASRRVVFLGRMTWQKGCDLFVQIAAHVNVPFTEFAMYGDGDQLRETAALIDQLRPVRGWQYFRSSRDMVVEFERVLSVNFMESTQQILPRAAGDVIIQSPADLTSEMSSNFQIVPIQGFKHFSHRLSGGSNHFLIRTDVLPGYAAAPDRFVVLAGNLSWENRATAFDEASVLVVPSRSEPFGMVIVEAMLNGVPVVCSEEVGALEKVTPGATFSPNDLYTAAGHVTKLLSDEDAWLAAVESQRRSVERYIASTPHLELSALWKSFDSGSVARARGAATGFLSTRV